MSDFHKALDFTLRFEGGYSDDPSDPGGATNFGITTAVYRAFTKDPLANVRAITQDEVRQIYEHRYWEPVCKDLPHPVDIVAFDTAVNCGVNRVHRWLEQIPAGDPGTRAAELLECRTAHYDLIIANNPKLAKFKKGWANRVRALRETANG